MFSYMWYRTFQTRLEPRAPETSGRAGAPTSGRAEPAPTTGRPISDCHGAVTRWPDRGRRRPGHSRSFSAGGSWAVVCACGGGACLSSRVMTWPEDTACRMKCQPVGCRMKKVCFSFLLSRPTRSSLSRRANSIQSSNGD